MGAGAVGTLLGGLLAHQGSRVHFCPHEPGVPEDGLRLRLPGERLRVEGLRPAVRSGAGQSSRIAVDYLLIALKRHQLKKLIRDSLAGLPARPRTGVICCNCQEEPRLALEQAAGVAACGCLTVMSAVLLQPGDVEVASRRAVLIHDGDKEVGRLLAFKTLGIETLAVQDLKPYADSFFLWQLLFLPAALCHSTGAHFLSYPEGRELACRLLEEGLETFRRRGESLAKLPYQDPRELLRRIQRRPREFAAARRLPDRAYNPVLQSLLRDRKTEVGELNSRLVRLATTAGVNAQWNWKLTEKLERVRRLGFYRDPAELYRAVK